MIELIILIDDVAYINTVSQKRIEYYKEKHKNHKGEDEIFSPIWVKALNGIDPKTLFGPHLYPFLKGGTKYIINDGRHRMLALKQLGFNKIKAKVTNQ